MDYKKLRLAYEDAGFVKIENFFSRSEVKNIISEYNSFLKNEAPLLKGKDINYADHDKNIVNSIHKLAIREGQFFWDLLYSEKMIKFATIFLNGNAIPRRAEMFAKPAEKGLKSPLHQDNFYWCLKPFSLGTALTIWTALDFCSEENGGITYLEGSHKIGVVNHVNSYAPGSSQTIDDPNIINEYKVVTPVLKPGDILIHDSHTIHCSADNISGKSRRGMTLQYQSETSVIDEKMQNHYETELQKQVEARTNN